MHRERPGNGGEKTVEIRLEEVSPLENVLELNGSVPDSQGCVVVKLNRASEPQLRKLKHILQNHPGPFEVMLQPLPRESHLPIYLPYSVQPEPQVLEEIKKTFTYGEVELRGTDNELIEFEEVSPLAEVG